MKRPLHIQWVAFHKKNLELKEAESFIMDSYKKIMGSRKRHYYMDSKCS